MATKEVNLQERGIKLTNPGWGRDDAVKDAAIYFLKIYKNLHPCCNFKQQLVLKSYRDDYERHQRYLEKNGTIARNSSTASS